ncbi:hypothetical protein OAT18_01220 [Tenacibaculum sp.]|nr:hypothetical protein [Tenacibaculum sp.]
MSALRILHFYQSSIRTINLTNATALEELSLYSTSLANLDVSTNTALKILHSYSGGLETINTDGATALEELYVHNNFLLTDLDVSTNTALTTLHCYQIGTETLNTTGAVSLIELKAYNNDISELDLSTNVALEIVDIRGTDLSSLNIKNGNNLDVTAFDATANPNLTCILVDDASASYLTTLPWDIDTIASFNDGNYCEYTNIPDTNFEAALESLGYDDISGDNQVPTALIENVTALDVSNQSISILTGIEDFTALETLVVNDNTISTIDLSYNASVTIINARNNGLTSLDVSACLGLDVILLENNSLTSLDLTNNTLLTRMWAQSNNFNALNVSNSPLLRALGISGSNLTSLDLTQNTALQQLYAAGNAITELDLSQNSVLRIISLASNNLSTLNAQNGYNNYVTDFTTTNNPNLYCALVDNVAYANDNFTGIDAQTIFSDTYCRYTNIPDSNFELALAALGYDDISGDNQVPTALIENIEILSILGNTPIADITGIEDFVSLKELEVHASSLTAVDVSNNILLEKLELGDNQLTSIDVSLLPNLFRLDLGENNLETLDVSNNESLNRLYLEYNPDLTYLNVQNDNNTNFAQFNTKSCPNLTCILVDDAVYSTANWTDIDSQTSFSDNTYCRYTEIPDINFEAALEALGYDDISGDGQVPTALIEVVNSLDLFSKSISNITGIGDFTALQTLDIQLNTINSIDLSQNTNIVNLYCASNNITSLDLANNTLLENVSCNNNPLVSINLTLNTSLTELNLEGCSLTDIDLSNNSALTSLNIQNNQLATLDLTDNVNLKSVFLQDNLITSLDLSNSEDLDDLYLQNNELTYLNIQNGKNIFLDEVNTTNNLDLTCILVDNASSANSWATIDSQTSFSDTYCRYTSIPDSNFEAALEALGYDDISGDNQVPTALIENIFSLTVDNLSISDFTGLQDFVSLKNLRASYNPMQSIDLTNLVDLQDLLMTNCTSLTSLDLSANTALTVMAINETGTFSTLDVSNNVSLQEIHAENIGLTDFTFTSLNVLEELYLSNNALTSLDLSSLEALKDLELNDNNLSYLNVKNNYNANIITFQILNNTNLTCVAVDDVAYSNLNWTNIDLQTSFGEYCRYTSIPDDVFEAVLVAYGYDDFAADGQAPTALIEVVTDLDLSNHSISDLTGIKDFTALQSLNISYTSIGSLDISEMPNLESLFAQSALTSLDASDTPALKSITVFDSTISQVDITNATALETLQLFRTGISTLDVSTNTALKQLEAYDCILLETINTTGALALEVLSVYNTNLSTLNTDGLIALTELNANNISTLNGFLDLSTNTSLEIVNISNTGLVSVDFRNNNNTAITSFDATSNPTLACVIVDDSVYSANSMNWTIDGTTIFTDTSCFTNYTAIPDANFEAALDALGYDDITGDLQVPTALISGVTNLDVSGKSIEDFTGIDDFASLEILNIANNDIEDLDLSGNKTIEELYCNGTITNSLNVSNMSALRILHCYESGVATINLTNATALEELYVYSSGVANLDVSTNTALKTLHGYSASLLTINTDGAAALEELYIYNSRQLTDLDVSTNTALTTLHCYQSGLETINTTGATALEELYIYNNVNLTDLDVSTNTALTTVHCYQSGLETINTTGATALEELYIYRNSLLTVDVSTNIELTTLHCYAQSMETLNTTGAVSLRDLQAGYNFISELDLSTNIALEIVDVNTAGLSSLNIKNGNNDDITTFNAYLNPNLTCILVDDVTYSTANWSLDIDITASFSDVICYTYTSIPDANFEAALGALGYDDITGDLQVPTELISVVTSLDLSGESIEDLTGIDDFASLEILNIANNDIDDLDLSGNTTIEELYCNSTVTNSLNVSNMSALHILHCYESSFTTINLTNTTTLEELYAYSIAVVDLDVSTNTALTTLHCYDNDLETINTNGATALEELYIYNNFDLTDLDVSTNTALTILDCHQIGSQTLNTTGAVSLTELQAYNNNISVMDLSTNVALEIVNVNGAGLSSLNIKNGNNIDITAFDAKGNPSLTCILVDDASAGYLTTLPWEINTTASFSDTGCNLTDYSLEIDVFLQGTALNPNTGEETLMRDDLRVAGYIPVTSPYADGLICDAVVFDTTGADAIVDWVFVELRDVTDNTVVSYSRSALLQRDGDVVDLDGTSALVFSTDSDNYYIAIKHRNHLGILSANAISLSTTIATINFISDTSLIEGGNNAVTDLGSSVFAMIAGDQDGNGQVQNTDINSVISLLGSSGYSNADLDMNGQIQNTDINNILNPNTGKGEQF